MILLKLLLPSFVQRISLVRLKMYKFNELNVKITFNFNHIYQIRTIIFEHRIWSSRASEKHVHQDIKLRKYQF